MNDQTTTIDTLKQKVKTFKAERGWGKKDQPAHIAMSISIEAAELLEHFQWGDDGHSTKTEWAEELADIMVYCMSFADATGIDIADAIDQKLQKAALKYPAATFKNNQDSEQDYWAIKKSHRGQS
jgi:dCTP diphosphatase